MAVGQSRVHESAVAGHADAFHYILRRNIGHSSEGVKSGT